MGRFRYRVSNVRSCFRGRFTVYLEVHSRVTDLMIVIISVLAHRFVQDRLYRRAVRLALGSLSVVGTATLTRILASQGRDEQDWTADYRLFSQRTLELQSSIRCPSAYRLGSLPRPRAARYSAR